MPIVEKVVRAASRLGEPETVLASALKKEVISRIIEFHYIIKKFEQKYKTSFEDFEKQDLLNILGHTWTVEEDYYEWDRAVTELRNLEEVLRDLE